MSAPHVSPIAPLAPWTADLPPQPDLPEGAQGRRGQGCRGQPLIDVQQQARNLIRTRLQAPPSAEVAGTAQRSIVSFPCLGAYQWIVSSQGRTLATCAAGYFPNSNRARGRASRGFWSRKKTSWEPTWS